MKRILKTIPLMLCIAMSLLVSGCFVNSDFDEKNIETYNSAVLEELDDSNPYWVDKTKLSESYLVQGMSSDGNSFDSRGSCRDITARTVVITVLYDCLDGTWDINEDSAMLDRYLYNMYIATEWMKQQTASYGYDNSYYYFNWKVYPNLVYHGSVDLSMKDAKAKKEIQREYAMQFDVDRIMQDYNARNVAFFFLYKTDTSNEVRAVTHNALVAFDAPYKFEYVDLPMFYKGEYEPPSVYAHEFLHLFGAQDLYRGGDLITQEYADYQNLSKTNDIMRIQYDINTAEYRYDRITNEFSEIDAYYTFLANSSDDVKHWDLGERM